MHSRRETIVWYAFAAVAYVLAAGVFLSTVLPPLAAAGRPGLSGSLLPWLAASAVLFGLGGLSVWRGRRAAEQRPPESSLPPQFRGGR
jgi:hypothetical protein